MKERPLRVLFALGSLGGGGTERQVVQILKHLDRQRFSPLLYLIYRTGELLGDVPADVPVFSFADRWQAPRWNYPGRLRRQQVAHLHQTLEEQQVDGIYDRTIHATLVAGEAARRAGRPHLSTVVNDPRLDLEASGQKFVWVKRRILRRAYHEAAHVLAVSAGVGEAVAKYYQLPSRRVTTVYNMFDFTELDHRAAEPSPEWPENRFHIVAAGRFQEQKGFEILLKAVQQVRQRPGCEDLAVHLLGQGPEESHLRQLIRSLHLEQIVSFEGFRTNPLPSYRRADLFCLPSRFEGMPNALVEALACGTPCVASDCPSGPREILRGGHYGILVPPGNVPRLAEALYAMRQAPEFWRARAAEARADLQDRFSIAQGIPRLETLMEHYFQASSSH